VQDIVTEVGFYHMTRSSSEETLPSLLGHTLTAGKRAVVRAGSQTRVDALDLALWRAPEPVWLPHGTAAIGQAEWQPIWLTCEQDVPNRATYLFLVDGTVASDTERFERVFDLFDGNLPDQVVEARARWATAKALGHTVAYWRQEPKGWKRAG
jgi:DNA polymerase-3 subunit chi